MTSKELTAKRKLWEKTYFRHVQFWFIFNLLHYLFLPTFVLFADILDDNEHVFTLYSHAKLVEGLKVLSEAL